VLHLQHVKTTVRKDSLIFYHFLILEFDVKTAVEKKSFWTLRRRAIYGKFRNVCTFMRTFNSDFFLIVPMVCDEQLVSPGCLQRQIKRHLSFNDKYDNEIRNQKHSDTNS
jgi:hypothetical protein